MCDFGNIGLQTFLGNICEEGQDIAPGLELKRSSIEAQLLLETGSGAGKEYLAWRDLPTQQLARLQRVRPIAKESKQNPGSGTQRGSQTTPIEEVQGDEELALRVRANLEAQKIDTLVVIGIGGSYLGAKAVIDFANAFPSRIQGKSLDIEFIGMNLSSAALHQLWLRLRSKRCAYYFVSKSGSTLESSLVFRLLWNKIQKELSPDILTQRVYIATNTTKPSPLLELGRYHKLPVLPIDSGIGGRFSVFSVAGLVPIAAAAVDITSLIQGAAFMRRLLRSTKWEHNPALRYASYRNYLYQQERKKIELLIYYHPHLASLAKWWQQLFGESEGKTRQVLYPSFLEFPTDLHSMGQWLQEGERNIFETVLDFPYPFSIKVPHVNDNKDALNYLTGRDLESIQRDIQTATIKAHEEGGVPCLRLYFTHLTQSKLAKEADADLESSLLQSLGALLYFFQYSAALSAYILGLNPFNQPGVERYKSYAQSRFRTKNKNNALRAM